MLGLALSLASAQRVPATSGPPAWLPLAPDESQPLLYADFKNGRYWASGALATLTDVCYQNLDWAPFDPAQVVAGVGLTSPDGATGPTIVEAPLGTAFVDGMTVVTGFRSSDAGGASVAGIYIQDFPDYNNSADVAFSCASGAQTQLQATGESTVLITGAQNDGPNSVANNFTPSRVAASLNGNVVSAFGITTATPYNALAISPYSIAVAPDSAVLSIAVYVLQLEADLPAMSA